MNDNYYDILGVTKDADQATIKKAYRLLAKKYHPDISKESDASERFSKIAEAYDVLGDEEKRQQYDTYGRYDNSQFNSRYQSGDFYSGVNRADIKFTQFGNLSLATKMLLIMILIIGAIIIIPTVLTILFIMLIFSLVRKILN
ncbi:MAG: DnaJ domain-containing protein [Mycoplasmatales bacterium]